MMDVSTNLQTPSSALLVAAHPDDADFGAAGTAAKWARAGSAVTYLVVTDGSKGSWDPAVVPARLAVRREEEQARACEMAGARPRIPQASRWCGGKHNGSQTGTCSLDPAPRACGCDHPRPVEAVHAPP